MAKTLDQRIADAKNAVSNAADGSPEKAAAEARLAELEALKADGFITQDEANRIDKKGKDDLNAYKAEVEAVLGGPLEDFKEAMENVKDSLTGKEGSGDSEAGEGEEGNVLQKLTGDLEALRQENDATKRSLYSERVENNLRRALSSIEPEEGKRLSLKDGRFEYVRPIANDAELVEKLMKGEKLPDGIYAERAKAVYTALPEVFESPQGSEESNGSSADPSVKTVAGLRIKEEPGPGIPETPTSGEGSELTAEERAKRATSVV